MTVPPGRGRLAPAGSGAPGAVGVWSLLGTAVEISCAGPGLRRTVADLMGAFAPAAGPAGPAHRFELVEGCGRHDRAHCAHRGEEAADVADAPGAVLAWVLTEMNHAAVDGFGGFAVHAGVVARHGQAVAFPAPSGTGKTTLVAACLAAGFEYVSDEALCVDPGSGRLVPYPRPLALSSWSRHALGLDAARAVDLDPDEVALAPRWAGAAVAEAPVAVAHVVRLVRGDGPVALVPAARADAMALLLERSFNHYKQPEAAFRLAGDLARASRSWRLELGDPAEAAAVLAARLA